MAAFRFIFIHMRILNKRKRKTQLLPSKQLNSSYIDEVRSTVSGREGSKFNAYQRALRDLKSARVH